MTVTAPAQTFTAAWRQEHIVDVLIAERAPRLAASPAWPVLRPLLSGLLGYGRARRMADSIADLPGRAALDHVSGLLRLRISARGLENLPRAGRMIVVCNHPTGIADGVAAYDALKAVRPDLCFYANSDAHRIARRLGEVLIPVQWVEAHRTREHARETLRLTREALEAERCLVIFPAGRLARRGPDGKLADLPWAPSAISLARRYETPVAPLHIAGPWSALFHLLDKVSTELRDITLFHELLNKQGRAFALTAGAPIPPEALAGEPAAVGQALKRFLERDLPAHPGRAFP